MAQPSVLIKHFLFSAVLSDISEVLNPALNVPYIQSVIGAFFQIQVLCCPRFSKFWFKNTSTNTLVKNWHCRTDTHGHLAGGGGEGGEGNVISKGREWGKGEGEGLRGYDNHGDRWGLIRNRLLLISHLCLCVRHYFIFFFFFICFSEVGSREATLFKTWIIKTINFTRPFLIILVYCCFSQ